MSPTASKSKTATDDEFDAPAEVTGIDWEALKGHLLVVVPRALEEDVKTAFGDTDAIRADVHDVSAKETTEDTLIFPKVLVGSLKNRLGKKVLATLGQGVAKPGQSAPWVLEDQSQNAKAVAAAKAYLGTVEKKAAPAKKAAAAPAAAVESWTDDDDADGDVPF